MVGREISLIRRGGFARECVNSGQSDYFDFSIK